MLALHLPSALVRRLFATLADSTRRGSRGGRRLAIGRLGERCVRKAAGLAVLLALGAGAAQAQLTASLASATWTQVNTSTQPSARVYPGMVYDPALGKIVLFGGSMNGNTYNDTWTFDGTTWTQLTPAQSPSARTAMGMVYDSALGEVVLFGGNNESGTLYNDTWAFNGTTWTQLNTSTSPSVRFDLNMVYDSALGKVVLFGGEGSSALGDTWLFDGTNWTQQNPATNPAPAYLAQIAYDSALGKVVMFSGGGSGSVTTTWTYDGNNWVALSPANSPPAQSGSNTAYDALTGQVVVFGQTTNDLWTFDGVTWTQQNPATTAPPRVFSGMAFDPAIGKVVLFGGATNPFFDDTWTLSLNPGSLGYANVCSSGTPTPCSQTATFTFTFSDTGGTIQAPAVLTQGAPNLDFTDAGTGTCTTNGTSYTYTSGSTCTVVVNFAPKSPGLRMGAIELLNSSGSVIATSMISGIGVGPVVTYTPGTISTVATISNADIAFDGAGNLYTAGYLNYKVQKVNPSTGIVTNVAGNGTYGFSGDGGPAVSAELRLPSSVAVDGAGNVYIADYFNSDVRVVTAATGIISSLTPSAGFAQPGGVSVDGSGNVYVADTGNQRIVKVVPATGAFSTVAGNGSAGYGGDGGPATSAKLYSPGAPAVDAAGNLYIPDPGNVRVRKVTAATGIISTVVGNGTAGYSGDGGPATSAEINSSLAVTVDAAGDLFISDGNNQRVRKVAAATGIITTIVGNGSTGDAGDGGPATSAQFGYPGPVAIDGFGNLYISAGGSIREVTAAPATVTLASTTVGSTSAAQTLTVNNIGNASLVFLTPTTGTDPSITGGFSIASGSTCPQLTISSGTGTLASGATCTDLITFTPLGAGANSGTLTTSDNTLNIVGSSQSATLSGTGLPPSGTTAQTITCPALPTTEYTASAPLTLTATASSGLTVYYTVTGPATVSGSTLSFTGTAGTVVVTANQGGNNTYKAANPVSQTITVSAPPSAYTAPTETLNTSSATQTAYVNITTAGTIASVSVLTQGTPNLDYKPVSGGTCTVGASFSAGQVCSVEYTFTPQYPGQRFGAVVLTSSTPAVLGSSYLNGIGNGPLVTYTPGTISTVAGNGGSGYNGDGVAATSASLYTPPGLALDGAGNMYVADCNNNRVRMVSAATGLITTVVGTGNGGYSGDGGPATSAQIQCPQNVSLDGAGNLFISDQINSVIREVNAATGIITTVAGNGSQGYSGDGGPATSATLGQPYGVVPDGAGNLYIADTYNHAVRKVTAATGIITTIAGNGNAGYNGDGIPATSATLYYLTRVALDAAGNVYIADQFNQRIRKVTVTTGLISTVAGNGSGGYSGDGGAAVNAQLNAPTDVALDPAGNLYINEYSNNDVREVNAATQIITTVVGNQGSGFGGDGGPATSAELSIPYGITLDPAGNLYVADLGNNRVRKVTALAAPFSFPDTNVGASSSPQTLTVNNIGTEPLTFPVPATGTDPSIATDFSIGSASTCPQLTTASSAGTLASGASCVDLLAFAPTTAGSFSGQIVVTDNTLGVTPSLQTTALSGTAAYATPIISALSPTSGYTSGGYTVTISGSHFTGASSVLFGSVAGTGVTVVNDSTITVIAPAESAGAVQVTVSNPSYTSNGVSFTYQVPPPVVVSISPGYGAAAGGGTISIAGMNFTGATAVDFGTVAATIKTVTSTLITATIPAGTAATTVDVTVTTPSATSATSTADQYTYSAATAYSAPTEPVGSTSATQTAYVNITTAGTLASISVVTQGVTGADFNAVTGGTCAVGVAYSVGQICSVQYTFAPITPGLRQGAVVLTSSTPTVLGTGYLTGTGTGPLATVTPGVISTVAGTGTGGFNGDSVPATSAEINTATGIAVDPAGNFYIADLFNNRVRKVTAATGMISTVAGTGTAGYNGDGIAAVNAELHSPAVVALDGAGNLYIADSGNQRVRKVWAATGIMTTVAGNGSAGYSGDGGAATSATLNNLRSVALDSQGNLYISDSGNVVIREVLAATGVISTVAGNGSQGYNGDGIAAKAAEFNGPDGLALDGLGNLYIADQGNSRVRKVSATGTIITVAGNGTAGESGDGGPATSAEISNVTGVNVDAAGNLYIVEYGGNRIREVSATTGLISTVVGNGGGYSGDGGAATHAGISAQTVAIDGYGNLYIADTNNNRIRKVTATGAPVSFATTNDGSTSSDSPNTITLNNIGNATLQVASTSLSSNAFSLSGSSTCPQGGSTLASGASCTDIVSFAPVYPDTGAQSGTLVTTENSLNVSGSTQSISLSGTAVVPVPVLNTLSSTSGLVTGGTVLTITGANLTGASAVKFGSVAGTNVNAVSATTVTVIVPAGSVGSVNVTVTTPGGTSNGLLYTYALGTKTITFPALTSPVTVNSTATLAATASNGDPVTYSVTAGTATISGTTITFTNAGAVTIAANSGATSSYSAASPVSQNVIVNPEPSAYAAPTEPVGTASATQTAYVNITTAGTLASVSVVTQGVTGADFNAVTGGTCAVGVAYSVGQACSVEYTFAPITPGLRQGAVVLTSSTPTVLGTGYLTGTGTGPLATVAPGKVSLVAGVLGVGGYNGDNIPATSAYLYNSIDIVMDPAGNIFIADYNNNRIRKVTASTGLISTVAGTGTGGYSGDGGPATSAKIQTPWALALDGAGNLYIADFNNQRIREVNAATGIISTVVGNGGRGYSGDNGPATSASLNYPTGVAVDTQNNIYISDNNNNRIRKVTAATGIITTVAGNGTQGYNQDNIAATSAELNSPQGVSVDAAGDIFIADYQNNRVRKVAAGTGIITTVAGNGTSGYLGNGLPATSSQLSSPYRTLVDAAGDLYIADAGGNYFWVVSATSGLMTIVLGDPNYPVECSARTDSYGDGCPATEAFTFQPAGMALDAAGNFYTVEERSSVVRKVTATGAPLSFASTEIGATSSDSPQTVTVNNIGNSALTFAVPDTGSNPLISPGFGIGASSTCPQLTSGSSAATLAAGSSCTDLVSFTPMAAGSTSGSVITTENSLNVAGSTQSVSLSGTGTQITQTISFTVASPVTYGVSPITLTATGGASGNPVTFSVLSGPGSVSGSTLTVTGAGSILIAANQLGNTNYAAASQATQTLVVNKATPTVTATTPAAIHYGTASTTLSATVAYTGILAPTGAVSFTIDSGSAVTAACTGSSSPLTCTASYPTSALSVGPHTITASVATDSNYGTASGTSTLTVSQATPSITVFAPATFTYGTAQVTLTASLSWPGPVQPSGAFTFSIDGGPGIPATCSVGGSCTATYNSAALSAGQHTLSAALASDTNYNAATSTSVAFTVSRAPLTVSIIGNPTKVYDGTTTATLTSANYTVSGLVGTDAVTITQPAGAYAAATAGSEAVTATLAPANFTATSGSLSNYSLPTSASGAGTITKASTTVTWATPAAITYGTALSSAQLNATASVGGTFVYSPASGAVLGAGSQTLSVVYTPADTTDYTTATASVTLTVNKATPVLTWATPAAITYGTALSGTQLNATSNLTGGSFAYTPASGTVLGAGSQTLSVVYTPADTTDYTTATTSVTLTVNKATPVLYWTTPAAITYGTALSGTQLNATSNLTGGSFAYTPGAGTVLHAGSQTLSVLYTPADTTDYTTATANVSLTVSALQTTIVWPTPAAIIYGTALSSTQLDAVAQDPNGNVIQGSYLYAPAPGSVPDAGLQPLSVAFTPTDTTDYVGSAGGTAVQVNQAAQTVAFVSTPSSPATVGNQVTVSATGGASGNPVTFSVLSGPGVISAASGLSRPGVSSALLTYTGPGTVVLAIDQAGNNDYTAATEVTTTVMVNPVVVPVGQSTTVTTVLTFAQAGTLNSLSYLTQGAPNLDFVAQAPSRGKQPGNGLQACSTSSAYSAGAQCSVTYVFQPTHPGQRLGAIEALDANGNVLGTEFISGIGTGPQAVFPGNTTPNVLATSAVDGLTTVAVDGSGDVFYITSGNLSELINDVPQTSGGSFPSIPAGSHQIAVDGAGNIDVASDAALYQYVAVNGSVTPSSQLQAIGNVPGEPNGVAVDGSGDIYASAGNSVIEVLAGSSGVIPANPTVLTLASSFNNPLGLAVDAAGNVYVADSGNQAVKEILAVGGTIPANNPTILTLGGGFGGPAGVAVDAAGDVYVADEGGGAVKEIIAVNGSIPASNPTILTLVSGFSRPAQVALDANGDVYVADGSNRTLSKISLSTPPTLTFADTNVGQTSTDSPQNFVVANNGYDPTNTDPLTLSSVSSGTSSFVIDPASTCSSSSSLEPGATCSVDVDFTPQTPGTPLTDALTLADNSLNNSESTQTAPLSGNGLQQTPVITVAPATIDYATASTPLSGTVAYTGTIAPIGAVTFTIDSGSAVTASCTGTTSPLTCSASYPTATLSATTHTITATLAATPGFLTASGTNTLTVNPIAPTITFSVPNHTYGDAPVTLAATSNSSAAFTYTLVSGPAAVNGSTLTITGAGAVVVQASQVAAGNYIAGSQSASFMVAQAVLGASIIGNPTKVYDTTTAATLTSANYALSGLVGTDAVTINQTVGAYASAAAGPEQVTVSLAPANFTATVGLLSNYILPASAVGPGTISQATSTTTVSCPASVTYNGAAQTPCTATVTGVGGLSQSLTVTYAANVNAGVNTATAAATYNGDSNHTGSTQTVNFTIAPALLTVTAGSFSGVYDGTAHAVSACTVSANFDSLTCTDSPANVGPHVGSGTVTAVISGSTANYTVTSNSGSWSITPLAVTVTAGSYSGVYDGASHAPSGCTSTFDGVSCTNSPVSVGPSVGSGTVNPVVSYTVGHPADYTLTKVTGTYSITQAPATITPNAATKVYGTADPVLTGTTTGFLPADNIVVYYSRTAGQTVAGSPYTISAAIPPNPALANYSVTYNTAAFTITAAAASVTPNAATKVYGSADPVLTGMLSGFLASDNITATYTRTSGETVAGSPYTISAALSPTAPLANYTITYNTAAFTITQAPTTTTVSCPASVTYNGAAQTPCTASVTGAGGLTQTLSVTYSANVNAGVNTASATATYNGDANHTGSTQTVNFTIVPAALTVSAGSYSGVYDGATHPISGCTVSTNFDGITCADSPAQVGPDAGSGTVTPVITGSTANYTVTTNNGTWSITAKPVTISAGSFSGTYDGNAHTVPACTSSYAGVACTDSPVSVGPAAGSGVVTPVVSVVTGMAADYVVTPQNGAWSIAQASSTTNVSCPASVTYNGTAQMPCTATVTGAGGLSQTLTVSYASNINVGVNTASATAIFNGDANHTGSTKTVAFSIAPAALTVTAGSYSGVYDGTAHALSACIVSSNPDGLTCTNNPVGPVGPDVGGAAVTPVISGSTSNYTVTSTNGSWSITAKPVTVTAGSYSGVYNGSAQSPSACTSSYAGVTCTNSPASVGPGVGSGTVNPVASYATGSAADYTVTKVSGTYSITQATASITPNAATKVYGAADPALTGMISGFLPADNIVVAYSRTAGETVAGSPYTISGTVAPNPALANYNVTYNTALFTITKLAASVTPNAATKVYGTADPVLTGTLTGFLPADGITATYARASGQTVAGSPYTISATLSPTAPLSNYAITYNTAAFTITPAAPVLSWTAPAVITYGTPLSATQLNATSNLTGGSFVYTPAVGTVLGAGTQTLSVTYTPADTSDYTTATTTVSLTVGQATPVVTWANPPSIVYGTGTGAAQKTATATGVGGVSLPGSYFYTTPDGTIFTVGTHPLGVAFTPTDSTDYVPVSAYAYLTVTKATPVVTWATPAAITYGTALSSAQLNATASVPGTYTYSPAVGTVLGAGTQTLSVTFTPTDTNDYSPVTKTVSLTVNKATPVITWPTPASITYGTPLSATQLDATANVPGSFFYTSPAGINPAGTLLPAGVSPLGAGFTPTDASDYNTASAYVTITVNKATTATALAVTTTQTVTGTTATLTATVKPQIGGTPTGTVTYYDGSSSLGSTALGAPFTTGVLPVGTDQLTAVYSGDSNFIGSSSGATAINSLAPTPVTLTPVLGAVFYPASSVAFTVIVPLKNLQSAAGTVTLYDGGTVIGTYSMPAGGVLAAVTPQLSVGTHNLVAVYSGNTQYPPGESSTVTVTASAL